MNKLVSIIVPVYKKKDTIQRCINSICKQSYNNIEIILIDDGCPDGCGEVCDKLAENDDRIVVYHQKNQGVSVARNNGVSYSKGEYISFVDADDVLENDFIIKLLNCFKADVDIVVGSNKPVKKYFERELTSKKAIEAMILDNNFGVNVWGKIYNRRIIMAKDFVPGLKMGEDMLALIRFIDRAKKIVYTSESNYLQIGAKNNSLDNTNIGEFYRIIDELFIMQNAFKHDDEIQLLFDCAMIQRAIWTINIMIDRSDKDFDILKKCIDVITDCSNSKTYGYLKLKEKIAVSLISKNINIYNLVYKTFSFIKRGCKF